jgi:hypothetical protein
MNAERLEQWRAFSSCFYSAIGVIDKKIFGAVGGDVGKGGQRSISRHNDWGAVRDPICVDAVQKRC